jgi:hypothetical protein
VRSGCLASADRALAAVTMTVTAAAQRCASDPGAQLDPAIGDLPDVGNESIPMKLPGPLTLHYKVN